jgi:hypothetical protein
MDVMPIRRTAGAQARAVRTELFAQRGQSPMNSQDLARSALQTAIGSGIRLAKQSVSAQTNAALIELMEQMREYLKVEADLHAAIASLRSRGSADPRTTCPGCGRPAIDGKVTCGDLACGLPSGLGR